MAKCAGGRHRRASEFRQIHLSNKLTYGTPTMYCVLYRPVLSVDAIANSIRSEQKQREKNNNNNAATSERTNERIVHVIGQMHVVRK